MGAHAIDKIILRNHLSYHEFRRYHTCPPLSNTMADGEWIDVPDSELPDNVRELFETDLPEWEGSIPDGQICQSHPLFTFGPSDEEEYEKYDQLVKDGISKDCENNATLGFGTVIGSNDGPLPLIWYLCEKCGEHFRHDSSD